MKISREQWLDNQYPESCWSRVASHALEKIISEGKNKKNMAEKKKPCDYSSDSPPILMVQYRGNHSQTLEKKVRDITNALIIFTTRKLKTFMPSLKSSFSSELKSKVVYRLECCGCKSIYVGQTVRHLTTRIEEHRKEDTPVEQHIRQCGSERGKSEFNIVAASSLYHSLEQLSNPEKEQFLPKILAIPGLSLNPNTTNPQKNLASLLCKASLAEKRQVVVWHDIINNSINSQRTNNFRACTAEELTEILKTLTNISAIVYCQRNGTPDIRNQLISSGILVIPITKCLILKKKRRTELVNENQALHQDVQLVLKSLRIVFEHQDNLPAVLSKLRSNTKKKSQSRRKAEKRRLVNIGEATVGRTDEEASTERVS